MRARILWLVGNIFSWWALSIKLLFSWWVLPMILSQTQNYNSFSWWALPIKISCFLMDLAHRFLLCPSRNLTHQENSKPMKKSKTNILIFFRWWPLQIKKIHPLMDLVHQENLAIWMGIARQLIYYPWCLLSIEK